MQHKPPRLANRMATTFNPTLPYLGCTGLHGRRQAHMLRGYIIQWDAQLPRRCLSGKLRLGILCGMALHWYRVQLQSIGCAPSLTPGSAL